MHDQIVDHETGEIIEVSPTVLGTWQDKVELEKTGLTITVALTFEEYEALSQSLVMMEIGVQWWKGDQLNYGEKQYGEKYAQAENRKELS